MNQSNYKSWRVLLHRVFAKQQAKKEQTHPVCLHAVDKYKNLESINAQKDRSKEFLGNKNIN